jgi:hypothetical protein
VCNRNLKDFPKTKVSRKPRRESETDAIEFAVDEMILAVVVMMMILPVTDDIASASH